MGLISGNSGDENIIRNGAHCYAVLLASAAADWKRFLAWFGVCGDGGNNI